MLPTAAGLLPLARCRQHAADFQSLSNTMGRPPEGITA
jgi:hypothetical protein